jgi:hypothetical protein
MGPVLVLLFACDLISSETGPPGTSGTVPNREGSSRFTTLRTCFSSTPWTLRNLSTRRGTSHSRVTDRNASMSGFPGGSCSVTPPALGQAGSKDCRFELPDRGRDGHLPFRSDLFVGFSFLGIVCSFLRDCRSFRLNTPTFSIKPAGEDSAGQLFIKAPWEDSCHSGMPLARTRNSALPEVLPPRVLQQRCGYAWSPPSFTKASNNCRTNSGPGISSRGNSTLPDGAAACRSAKILWSRSIASI